LYQKNDKLNKTQSTHIKVLTRKALNRRHIPDKGLLTPPT